METSHNPNQVQTEIAVQSRLSIRPKLIAASRRKSMCQVICSERQFFGQIRSLENIGPEVTDEELSVRSLFYARKFFDYLKNFGIELVADPQVRGTLATFSLSLKPAWSEESVQERLNGLALMAPVAVSLDQPDIAAFCYEPIMRTALQDQFGAFAAQLQRLTVGEIRPALEQCARQLLSAPVNPPTNEFEQELQEMEYTAFLVAAGKRDPLAKQRQIEAFRQGEELLYKNAQDEARRKEWENRED